MFKRFSSSDWALVGGDPYFVGYTTVAGTNTSVVVTPANGDNLADIHGPITMVDLLDAAGLDYKFYSENYPTSGECFFGVGYGNESNSFVSAGINSLYRRKHNTIISFDTFYNSPARCSTQKDFNDLTRDLADGNLPAVSIIVPNQANDGHDTSVNFTANWLQPFLQNQFFASPAVSASRVLLHVTYDESEDDVSNTVYSTLLGNAVPASLIGKSDKNYYNHYSVLATVEANWGLGNLGRGDVQVDTIPFALTAATENVFTPTVACNICGQTGFHVTKPSVSISLPTGASSTCGALEQMALAGQVDCLAQNVGVVFTTCGCAGTGQWFDKYVFLILENQGFNAVYSNSYFQALAATGVLQTNYHAVAHPSQPNCTYISEFWLCRKQSSVESIRWRVCLCVDL